MALVYRIVFLLDANLFIKTFLFPSVSALNTGSNFALNVEYSRLENELVVLQLSCLTSFLSTYTCILLLLF